MLKLRLMNTKTDQQLNELFILFSTVISNTIDMNTTIAI